MAVWMVVGVLGLGGIVAAFATHRHAGDIEPTVREFAEFRDAISRQVDGAHDDTRAIRRHLDLRRTHRVGEREGHRLG